MYKYTCVSLKKQERDSPWRTSEQEIYQMAHHAGDAYRKAKSSRIPHYPPRIALARIVSGAPESNKITEQTATVILSLFHVSGGYHVPNV